MFCLEKKNVFFFQIDRSVRNLRYQYDGANWGGGGRKRRKRLPRRVGNIIMAIHMRLQMKLLRGRWFVSWFFFFSSGFHPLFPNVKFFSCRDSSLFQRWRFLPERFVVVCPGQLQSGLSFGFPTLPGNWGRKEPSYAWWRKPSASHRQWRKTQCNFQSRRTANL